MTCQHTPTPRALIQTLLLSIAISLFTACSGGGGGEASLNDDNGGGGGGGGGTTTIYISLQAKSGSWTGPLSEEMQVAASKTSATATWEEPTRSLDGTCLPDPIDTYIAHIGKASGQYDTTITAVKASDTQLTCTAGNKTDTQCSKTIQNCSYVFTLPTT